MRVLASLVCVLLSSPQSPSVARLTLAAPEGSFAVLRVRLDDDASRSSATAMDVVVDGRRDQIVVLTPGTKRLSYEALLGPLPVGSHEVRLEPSALWNWDASLKVADFSAEIVPQGDARAEYLAHAPAIGLRPDTIGTASDLPLMMYVEDAREGGSRWLRYSVIFSHEDGGTPGVALMARWGRTTDIELAYEVELRDGRVIQGRYQGPDHRVIPKARLDVQPPLLLVSTLNNMFLDRGHAAAVVRMAPELIDLSGRSRESVMDDRPWIHRVMARELAAERPAWVGDPRDYLYVDLKLESRGAGVALGARSADGRTWWSDRGRTDLVVSRQGEMRIAVPAAAAADVRAIAVRCDARLDAGQPADSARCSVELRKAFRLNAEHRPGANVISPARLLLDAGTSHEIGIAAADKIRP
jgi:hypothetical protein